MLIDIAWFTGGLISLIIGAELLINGASRIAARFGISPLVIGLTVVAFGTSAPESAVTIGAAMSGSTSVALGNVVGSNIFNILLILGLSALIAPLVVDRVLIRREVPIMVAVSLLLVGLLLDSLLSRYEAIALFLLLLVYIGFLLHQATRGASRGDPSGEDAGDLLATTGLSKIPAPLLVVIGLAMLVLGGNWLVDAAVSIATLFGVSELVIGLTVVALGTSMPELATSIMALIRGHRDLAVGNVIGSNLFNILCCLGLAGMVAPDGLSAPPALLRFDIWVMVTAAACCLPIIVTNNEISRWEGGLLLAYCGAYLAYTLLAATHHDSLPAFSYVMMSFVIPASALVLFGSLVSSFRRRPT